MRNLLLLSLLAAPGPAAAQTPVQYFLDGHLGARTYRGKPTYVYLVSGLLHDSALVENGRFELRGTVPEATKAMLTMRRSAKDLADYKAIFFLEPGTLVFTSPDSLKNAQVGGTPLTDTWRALYKAQEPIRQQLSTLEKTWQAATPGQQQSPTFKSELEARRTMLLREKIRVDSAFVRAHPASFISLTVLNPMSR